MSHQSRFYRWIGGIFLAMILLEFIVIALFPYPGRVYGMPLARKISGVCFVAGVMGIAWAILFRSQLERGKLTITSLLALIVMQSGLFWFIATFDSFDFH